MDQIPDGSLEGRRHDGNRDKTESKERGEWEAIALTSGEHPRRTEDERPPQDALTPCKPCASPANLASIMLTIDVLSKRLALSEWQTRRLFYALRPLLQGLQASKPGQALQIPSSTIGLFERAAQMKSEGIALGSLAQALQEEMVPTASEAPSHQGGSNVQAPPLESATPLATDEPWQLLLAEKDKRIHDLEEDRNEWRELALDYKRQLPAPSPRRSWLRRILRPSVAVQS